MPDVRKRNVTKAGAVELEESTLDDVQGAKPVIKDGTTSANKISDAVRKLL